MTLTQLRTPVESIVCCADALIKGEYGALDPRLTDDVTIIRENAQMLLNRLQTLPEDWLRQADARQIKHDLINPISNILGWVYVLVTGIDGELTPTQHDQLRAIQTNSDGVKRQIEAEFMLQRPL